MFFKKDNFSHRKNAFYLAFLWTDYIFRFFHSITWTIFQEEALSHRTDTSQNIVQKVTPPFFEQTFQQIDLPVCFSWLDKRKMTLCASKIRPKLQCKFCTLTVQQKQPFSRLLLNKQNIIFDPYSGVSETRPLQCNFQTTKTHL